MEEFQLKHTSGQWRICTDSSKVSLKQCYPTRAISSLLSHWLK